MAECGWKCGDDTPDHKHYAVVVRELSGKLLGRLTPRGGAAHNKIYASILSKERADYIAADINNQGQFRAHVIPF